MVTVLRRRGKTNRPVHRCRTFPPVHCKPRPLAALTADAIDDYCRRIITNDLMIADIEDRDWQHSLMLLVSLWKEVPPNASTIFLVPVKPHVRGLWLNGRVPGMTVEAVPIATASVPLLFARLQDMERLIGLT